MIRLSQFPRRFCALVLAMSLAAVGLVIGSAAPAAAAARGFTPAFTANATGDIIIRGNTLETCRAGSVQANGTATCAMAQGGSNQQNNNFFMDYVDADGTTGNTTFNSSSATVTVPAGATVLYAGLTWGGTTGAGALASYPALTGAVAPNAAARDKAKFKVPGATAYSEVTATTLDNVGSPYQAFAEVTDAVKAAGSGSYTIADVQAGTGGGTYAGWSLTVAYSDPTLPSRNLVVFTGYDTVSSTVGGSVDIPVSGFTTPLTGTVTTKIGVVAYEGDRGSAGDSMSIDSKPLTNSLNPISDVFNSSLTDANVAVTNRTPNYTNLMGFDIDRFDATGALANGSTSTVVHLTTSSDTYYPGIMTFVTDLYSSALTATKTVTDANGGSLLRGETLNYAITVRNGGGDGATATTLSDAVPVGTTYVPGSLTVGGTGATDPTGDDAGDVTSGNVSARLGTGATSTTGGVLAPAATSVVTFSVTVNSTVADGATVVNTATFNNRDQTTGVAYSGGSNTVTSTALVPPVLGGTLAVGTLGAPYSSGFTPNSGTGTGPFTYSISGGTLPAGLTLNPSTGRITGTPTAAGSSSVTVQVVDANNRTATRTQTIVVSAAPIVDFTPPAGEIGIAYSAQPTVTGGTSPVAWAVSAGTLPAGLAINTATGAITGTPTAPGTSNFTLTATDINGATASQAATLVIVTAPTLTFPAALTAPVNTAYSRTLSFTGGLGPFVWSISAGTLPAGLTLNADTGVVSGTPSSVGSSSFTVRVVDSKGVADTRAATLDVVAAVSTVALSTPATVRYGAPVTLTAAIGPNSPTGTVTFTDVPTTGPQAGTTITLGTAALTDGAGTVTTTLPAFGVNTIKATYSGDSTHTAATSTTTQIEVSAYSGQLIVTEYRTSGPGGAGDNYVEILNTGPAVPLAGIKVTADSGTVRTLPANAGTLGTGRSYLITGAGYTLTTTATSDYPVATVGTGGITLTAPDTASTATDAVGPTSGAHTGTGLPPITGNPDSQWAWVRTEIAGAAANSRNNAADFQLVSTGFAPVGGVQPTLGSPSPTGTTDPYQHNATLRSTLLDPAKTAAAAPNRVITTGTAGRLVIRRTITNTTGQTVTAAKVRVSALSERYGAPQPGTNPQPARIAQLRATNPAAPTEQVTLTGGATVTVQDLSVDTPSAGPGGGLNSTFTVPLPSGGLAPNATINVAFTFTPDTGGTFWYAYDVDATTTAAPQARRAAPNTTTPNTTASKTDGRISALRSTTRRSVATDTGQLR